MMVLMRILFLENFLEGHYFSELIFIGFGLENMMAFEGLNY